MASAFNPTLSRRKRFLPEYRRLFEALLNIPDVDVQHRVAQAVNNMQKCSVCKNKISLTKDIATQTGDTLKPTNETDQLQFGENKEPGADNSDQVPAKRRRKRKRACPKVVKKAQHSNSNPILRQENTTPKKMDTDESVVIEIRSDDEAVQNFIANDLMDFENPEPSIEDVRDQMKLELLTFYKYDHGYLPIHDAIATNEVNKLKRQLYVMKFRKEELLSLYTDFGDNPIQLAIKKNCIIDIFNELLKEVTDLNDCDDDECNTIIHLAVIYLKHYEQNEERSILKILESLLQKVDMEILLKRNNDGLTALQIAVNEDNFLMVEKIFDVLDKRLNLKPLTGKHIDKQTLKNHYDIACNDLEDRQIDELKSKILNATSMKCGRTALYFAIERQYDHLIYLLMAHKSNPTIKNFSGQDAKTYYTEYGKNPTIAGVLDRLTAMFS